MLCSSVRVKASSNDSRLTYYSLRPSDFLKSNEPICMQFLPDVCLKPRNNWLDFGDDLDYDPDHQVRSTCNLTFRLSLLGLIIED